jgi:cellulose biosynthesis protein BcsQ
LKGGVGKTTASALTALYVEQNQSRPVILIDMDPQGGSTSLFMGSKAKNRLTLFDALRDEMEGMNSREDMWEALYPVPNKNNRLFILPADKRLTSLASSGAPTDLLLYALKSAEYEFNGEKPVIIIDTGTAPNIVGMGMYAADAVVIPMMMSRQTVQPTANALAMLVKYRRRLLGILPVSVGKAKWEEATLEAWTEKLSSAPGLQSLGGKIFPSVPHSKSIERGGWVGGSIPSRVVDPLDAIFYELFGYSAKPEEVVPMDTKKSVGKTVLPEKSVADNSQPIPADSEVAEEKVEEMING